MSKRNEMHCFFYKAQKKIKFEYNKRVMNFTTIKSPIQPDTLAKMCNGLNHFLMFYYDTDIEEYNNISKHIFKTYADICADKLYKLKPETYAQMQMPLISKYCQLDSYLIDRICYYVKNNNVENIVSSDATTNITLNNEHANILACIATAVKFSYIYASLLRGVLKFEEVMVEFIDDLMANVIDGARKYFVISNPDLQNGNSDAANEYIDTIDMHSYLDNFVILLVSKIWNTAADPNFQRKFEETGQDTFYYARKHKISMLTSFKKYLPPAIDDEHAMKYANGKEESKRVYYTLDKDYKDFQFVSKNLAAYIQTVIRNIINKQETKVDILDVNIPEFVIDGTSERTIKKDAAFYEDRFRHLFDARKDTAINLFKQIITELKKYDLDLSFIKNFKISKTHLFNQLVIHKCLLCLSGESRVYSETFGLYNKFLLLLFYLGIKSRPDLDYLHDVVDIMVMNPSNLVSTTDEQIEEFLAENNASDIHPRAFNAVLKLYSNATSQKMLTKEEFLNVFLFLESPSKVRHLLFPNTYTDEEDKEDKHDIPRRILDIHASVMKGMM